MNETVFPEVTTSRFVCGESSIEVIGLGKVKLVVNVRVRRSHHLDATVSTCTRALDENFRERQATHHSMRADRPMCQHFLSWQQEYPPYIVGEKAKGRQKLELT